MDPVKRTSAPSAPQVTALAAGLESHSTLGPFLALLRWWDANHRDAPLEVVALHHGPLADDVRALAPTTLVHDPHGWTIPRLAQRLGLRRAAGALTSMDLRRRLRVDHPLYLPDPSGARLVHWLPTDAGPLTTHISAASSGLTGLRSEDEAVLLARTDRWIVGSAHHLDQLRQAGASGSIIELPDLLDANEVDLADNVTAAVEQVRQSLMADRGVPLDAPLVVGVGAADWWKEPDAFVRVAWELINHPDNRGAHLCWVADGATDRMLWPLRHDLAHADLEQRVHVLDGGGPSWRYVAAADVLIDTRLVSTATPMASATRRFARSVVTFAGHGERTESDRRIQEVPHLDCRSMADAVRAELAEPSDPEPAHRPLAPSDPRRPDVGGPLIRDLILQP